VLFGSEPVRMPQRRSSHRRVTDGAWPYDGWPAAHPDDVEEADVHLQAGSEWGAAVRMRHEQ